LPLQQFEMFRQFVADRLVTMRIGAEQLDARRVTLLRKYIQSGQDLRLADAKIKNDGLSAAPGVDLRFSAGRNPLA
jgi:hypothetical protein